jgi:hypothetical protein
MGWLTGGLASGFSAFCSWLGTFRLKKLSMLMFLSLLHSWQRTAMVTSCTSKSVSNSNLLTVPHSQVNDLEIFETSFMVVAFLYVVAVSADASCPLVVLNRIALRAGRLIKQDEWLTLA